MQMLMAFTHGARSISPVAPIRGGFNEVLNRRLSYIAARPQENSAREALSRKTSSSIDRRAK